MRNLLKNELGGLSEDSVVLALIPAKHFQDANINLLKLLLKYGTGSYIAVNRPYKVMLELLKKSRISTEKISFIDCITEDLQEKGEGNCYYIDSPSDLTEIGIALEPIFKREDHEFVMLDSLDALLVYNDAYTIIKFIHYLSNKARMHKHRLVILSLHEETNSRLINELSQFCDKVIDLSHLH